MLSRTTTLIVRRGLATASSNNKKTTNNSGDGAEEKNPYKETAKAAVLWAAIIGASAVVIEWVDHVNASKLEMRLLGERVFYTERAVRDNNMVSERNFKRITSLEKGLKELEKRFNEQVNYADEFTMVRHQIDHLQKQTKMLSRIEEAVVESARTKECPRKCGFPYNSYHDFYVPECSKGEPLHRCQDCGYAVGVGGICAGNCDIYRAENERIKAEKEKNRKSKK